MEPDDIGVREGDRVVLRLTSEKPAEVRLHACGLGGEVTPGEVARLSFEADLTGGFEIEDHDSGYVLGVHLVQPR